MYDEKIFNNQLKLFRKNDKNNIKVKYNMLNQLDLCGRENIYNINMIVESKDEAVKFMDKVNNPDKSWKTISDIIIDVRKEKLGQIEGLNKNYIEKLLLKSDYIGLHKELERVFLHKIMFVTVLEFFKKVSKFGLDIVCNKINELRSNGYSTTMCYIQ